MSDGKTIIHSLLTAATVTVAGAGIYYLKVALVTEAPVATPETPATQGGNPPALHPTPDGTMSGELEDPATRVATPTPPPAPPAVAESHPGREPRKLRIAHHLGHHPKPVQESAAPLMAAPPSAPSALPPPAANENMVARPSPKEVTAPHQAQEARPSDTASKDADKNAEKSDFKYALGAGQYRLPRWIGARTNETIAIPFFDINWRDQVELSSADGLVVDLLHGERWHGGLVGTMVWGRSRKDLQALAGRLGTLKDTVQGGVYLEYALTPWFTLGGRWRHDIETTRGAYTDLYAELDLPDIGPIEHSLKLSGEAMNRKAMRRYFGVNDQEARALGIPAYAPGGGSSRVFLSYDTFIPTSQHTGFAVSIGTARLVGNAANSSLIHSFGKTRQNDAMVAFAVQF